MSNSLQFKRQAIHTHINTFHWDLNIKYSVDGTKITTGNFIVEFDPKIQKKIKEAKSLLCLYIK